jgi:hypothetical protein
MADVKKKFDSVGGSEAGSWLTIVDVDGVDTDIKIKLKGVDSKAFKDQTLKIRRYVNSMKEKGKYVKEDEMDDKSFQMLAASTIEWENLEEDGAEIKCTPENAEYIYRCYPIIADQVSSFIVQRSNFLGE